MMAGILSWFWKSEDNSLQQVTKLVERHTVTDLKHFPIIITDVRATNFVFK